MMFDGFFENNSPMKTERLSRKRADNIKAAVLKGINESEETSMKKRNIVRPFIIAATVAALGTASLVSANAVTDGAVSEGLSKFFTVLINGKETEIEGEYTKYEENGVVIEEYSFEIPDGEGEGDTVNIRYSDIEEGHQQDEADEIVEFENGEYSFDYDDSEGLEIKINE